MDASSKLPNNVPGKYHTTEECDGCAYCAAVAPDNFEFDKPTNTYFVGKQPVDAEEEELVLEAMEDCPLDAIRIEDEASEEDLLVEDNNGRGGS
jgi:ferredoxin